MSLAHKIVNTCLRVNEKDNVTIFLYPRHIPFAEELSEECFKKGADVNLSLYTDKFYQSYVRELSAESLKQPSVFCEALSEASTAEIWMGAVEDPTVFREVPPEKRAADGEGESKAHAPYYKKVRSLGLGMAQVTEKRAATYGFNYPVWKQTMEAASDVDYGELARTGRGLKEILSKSSTLRITAPNGTDLTIKIEGSTWRVNDGVIDDEDVKEENLADGIPSGSIYTHPPPDSAEGTICFKTKTPYAGRIVEEVKWNFRGGKVTEFTGDAGAMFVKEEFDNAAGDKDKIALVVLGFNSRAEEGFSINDIVPGAVTIGIGSNEIFGGSNKSGFSYQHALVGGNIEADGRALVRDGKIQAL